MSSIGSRLKAERERLGLSQAEFYRACGTSKSMQFYFETDHSVPGGAYLIAADKLGVDVLYVLTGRRGNPVPRAQAQSQVHVGPEQMQSQSQGGVTVSQELGGSQAQSQGQSKKREDWLVSDDLRALVECIAEAMPYWCETPQLHAHDGDRDRLHARLVHLGQLGLIEYREKSFTEHRMVGDAKITAAGADWLRPDVGLSAELKAVTVRLHTDTVRELLAAGIAADETLSPEKKEGLLSGLKKIKDVALQELTKQLLQKGFTHLTDIVEALPELLRLVKI